MNDFQNWSVLGNFYGFIHIVLYPMALLTETLSNIIEQSGGDIIRSDGQKRHQSTF